MRYQIQFKLFGIHVHFPASLTQFNRLSIKVSIAATTTQRAGTTNPKSACKSHNASHSQNSHAMPNLLNIGIKKCGRNVLFVWC